MCLDAACGDGFVNAGVEDCDTEENTAACDEDCTAASCGDGFFNAAAEECDLSAPDPDPYCRPDCVLAAVAKGTGCSASSTSTSLWLVLVGLCAIVTRARLRRPERRRPPRP